MAGNNTALLQAIPPAPGKDVKLFEEMKLFPRRASKPSLPGQFEVFVVFSTVGQLVVHRGQGVEGLADVIVSIGRLGRGFLMGTASGQEW